MNKKNSLIKFFGTVAAALVVASVAAPGNGLASDADNVTVLPPLQISDPALIGLPKAPGALTSPPPLPPAQNFSQTLANNKYLKDVSSAITAVGNSSVYVTATSSGSPAATQVGVTATVQRWTGNAWVDIPSPVPNSSVTSTSSVGFTKSVTKGYYYRVKSEHWATGGGSREISTLFSGTALAN
ncbi:hypothetical protein [Saccharibacillus alkalitolerans]|uniref:Uncharacterized protein n=1 Tax=Saccharibacillus alkalitolerans TaxID=2705290 RepID=A0ABX0F156_9BACL|nr:hypothetical protein [Saccharibacillus alkalitolerans]NGZ74626.1 hypothetical protein [Saccharibacillus alkalitolerans]